MSDIPGSLFKTGSIDNLFDTNRGLVAAALLDRMVDLLSSDGGVLINTVADTGLQVIDGGGGTVDIKAGTGYDKFGQRIYLAADDLAGGLYTGTVDLSAGINLSANYNVKLDINNAGAVEIDCRGATPAATTIDEIVAAINAAGFGTIAYRSDSAGNIGAAGAYVTIKSSTTGAASEVEFVAPAANDATLEMFGLSEAAYPHTYAGGGGYAVPNDSATYNVVIEHLTVESVTGNFLSGYPSAGENTNVKQLDSYQVSVTSLSPVSSATEHELLLATVVNTGGVLTITDNRANIILRLQGFDAFTGTSAQQLLVGVGSLGTNNAGLAVLTESNDPANPVQLRIWDVNPDNNHPQRREAYMTLKWGYEYLTGVHNAGDGVNTIRVTGVKSGSLAMDVAADELIGQYLYSSEFTSSDKKYEITDNLATAAGITVITLETAYADESMTETGYVVADGDTIELRFTPYIGGQEYAHLATTRVLSEAYITDPTFTIEIPLFLSGSATQFKVHIRIKKGTNGKSDWVEMASGSYDPDHAGGGQGTQNYSAPYTAVLPDLDEASYPGSLTLTATTSGFQIVASGWKHPTDADKQYHELEFIRTTADTVDWNDYINSIRWKSQDLFHDIPTSTVRKWAVGVRPIQNGQVVGTPQTGSIVSGSMGVAPNDQALLNNVPIDLRTFSGTMAGTSPYTLSVIKIPAGSATAVQVESMEAYLSQRQCILTDVNGNDFLIDMDGVHLSGATIILEGLTNLAGASETPAAGAFTINTSERGRRIAIVGAIQIEYVSVKGYFDSDIIKGASVGDPAVLRVCQNSVDGKTNADLQEVYANDTSYTVDTDFEIINDHGALGILLDFWDPSAGNNTACIQGRYTQFMRPKVQKTDSGVSQL